MRPSISVTLEPGLERGVPWGCDLYTFVTSAAGHMMRTLQKPRKNRPSKRQVNHRRFLHNMIQRKFADIEAANHRLASALHFKEEGKKTLASEEPQTPDQSISSSLQHPGRCSAHTDAGGIAKSRSDISIGSHEADTREKRQPDVGHLWNRSSKSQPARQNNQSKAGQNNASGNHKLVEFTSMTSPIDYHHKEQLCHAEYYDDESPLKFTEDSQTTQPDSTFIQNVDISPVFSPGLSPLCLDSCDFSVEMFTDISACTQAQKSITDITDSQWTDVDLFSVCNKDLEGCMDVEAYFESICACQGDAVQEVGADDVGFADQSSSAIDRICSNGPEVEDQHCDAGEYKYEYGYSGDGLQGLTVNHLHSAPRQNKDTAETQFGFKQSQGVIQNQLPTSMSYHYGMPELQMYQLPQKQSPCMLENNQNFTPFEGVAQSFSVPFLNPEHRPIPTPPHEDDWLFTDILKDKKSTSCQEHISSFE